MTPYSSAATRQPLWLIGSLLLGFILAQSAALLHAEIHPYHHHDDGCLDFENVSKQTPFVSFEPPPLNLTPQLCVTDLWWPQWHQQPLLSVFWPRGPPAHITFL